MEDKNQLITKIQKLFAVAEGSSNSKMDSQEIANEAISALLLARKLLAKHHLSESDIRAQAETNNIVYVPPVFGQTTTYNPFKRKNARGLNQRRIWFEKLAEVLAEGNYCRIGLIPEEGGIIFFGLEMDRDVAIFTLNSLGAIADNLCKYEMKRAQTTAGMTNFRNPSLSSPEWQGEDVFIESFHQGFRLIIKKVFDDMKADENGNTPNARDDYFEDNCPYRHKPAYVWVRDEDSTRIENYYVKIGQEIGQRAVDKLSLSEGTAKVASIIQTNHIKKQEKAKEEQKQLYDKLGIDESLPPEVIIAIDDSGSMRSMNKSEQAKSGATSYAENANKNGYKVGLVTFGSSEEQFIKPKQELNGEFFSAINKLSPYGSTPMHEAIRKSTEYFKSTKARRLLVIVTDGQPNSEELALSTAKIAKEDYGIVIKTIGTDDAPKAFLDALASSGKSLLVGNAALGEGIKTIGLLGA